MDENDDEAFHNEFLKDARDGKFSKLKRKLAAFPGIFNGGPFELMLRIPRIIDLSEKRYPEESEELRDNLENVLFYEFFKIETLTEPVNKKSNDKWVRNDRFLLDSIFYQRTQSFYEAHGNKIKFDIKELAQSTLFRLSSEADDHPVLTSNYFLNLFLLSKIFIIKEHFNLVINFYKEYNSYNSTTDALRELVYIIKKAVDSPDKQLIVVSTQCFRHRYAVTKETADKYCIELVKLFSEKLEIFDPQFNNPFRERPEIYIDEIDSFQKVKDVHPSQVKHLVPLTLDEDTIQTAIEKIIGEHFHQQDWGGEINDIYTSHIRLKGQRMNGAFMLKGKGLKGKLNIKNCGKNGDQLLRLVQSNAEIFFVQHIGEISQEVRTDIAQKIELLRFRGKSSYYCIIDGADTARILNAYGYLNAPKK